MVGVTVEPPSPPPAPRPPSLRAPSPAPSNSGSTVRSTSYIDPTDPDDARRNSFMAYTQGHSNHFHPSLEGTSHSPTRLLSAFFNAILATALFRCWHILLFYIGWATMVTLVNEKVEGANLTFSNTLLTVVGTVLGFVISYRTTSSFERYNEGRRFWSQIILASRTLARAVWFHVPELLPVTPDDEKEDRTEEERKARNLIEKKTVINLIEAFAVAVKHYLRGEEGIAYVDLYHLVKFLPSYAFPAGVIPTEHEAQANIARTQSYREAASSSSKLDLHDIEEEEDEKDMRMEKGRATGVESRMEQGYANGNGVAREADGEMRPSVSVEPASPDVLGPNGYSPTAPADGAHPQQHVTLDLPPPVTAATTTHRQRGLSIRSSVSHSRSVRSLSTGQGGGSAAGGRRRSFSASSQRTARPHGNAAYPYPKPAPTFHTSEDEGVVLLPASLPPKHTLFDVFPFSLFVRFFLAREHRHRLRHAVGLGGAAGGGQGGGGGTRQVEGKKAAKMRAKTVVVTRNVPLEISMYLTSYVATLGARKAIDVPTNNLLVSSINQLTDALTGLERILTTPIPFSYSIHLWLVTIIYNLALPFQIYATLKWLTIPASGIVSFIFFGFLVAGEEIENPFGYDKNDLNMDHFTHNIIRNELRALTAFPPPAPELWAFSPRNDRLFVVSDPMLASHSNVAALAKELKDRAQSQANAAQHGNGLGNGLGAGSNTVLGLGGHSEHGMSLDSRRMDLQTGVAVGAGVGVSASVGAIAGLGAGLTPEEWVRRGPAAMRDALARAH